jgi:DNA-directed RNA polymerase II subunit RPB11
MGLLRHKEIIYAGYRELHPLQHTVEIKVQTNGNVRPIDALKTTIQTLASEFTILEQQWTTLVDNNLKKTLKTEYEA